MNFRIGILFLTLGPLIAAENLPIPAGKAGLPQNTAKAEAEMFTPVMEGNTVSAGNKKIQLTDTFKLSITESGHTIAESRYVFTLTDRKTGKTTWHSLGSRRQGMYKTGWEGKKKISEEKISIGDYTWDFARQETELLPDGLLQVTFTWKDPDPEKYTLKLYGCFINVPYSVGGGKRIVCDGKTFSLPTTPVNFITTVGGEKPHSIQFFPDDPARTFTISGKAGELAGISCFALKDTLRFDLKENRPAGKLVFTIDIRKGVRPAVSDAMRGNVDFRALDNLDMPDNSSRNILVNPSFEQGLLGYHFFEEGYNQSREKWETPMYALDSKERVFGKNSLRITTFFAHKKGDDYRNLNTACNISTQHVAVAPGVYTLSFYIKGSHPGEQTFNIWVAPYNYGPYTTWLAVKNGKLSLPVTKEWKRYVTTFRIESTMPLSVRFNAVSSQRRGFVWIDGLQVEKGDRMSAFDVKAAEARLVTSDPDNFVSASAPLDAKLEIQSVPDSTGKGVTTVRNFYRETVAKREFSFRTDRNGRAVVPLNLDGIGKGIFLLRTDYTLADGRKCYDLHRLTILNFLKNQHPLRFLFSDNYGGLYENPDLYRILDRYKKLGFGYKAQDYVGDPLIHSTFEKFGIPISEIIIVRGYKAKDGSRHFGAAEDLLHRPYYHNRSDFLFRDFHLDSNGTITPEYLEKVRKGCEKLARKYPHVIRWQFSNEMGAGFPNEWWSKEGTPEKRAEIFARILKAFSDGIKTGNPNAEVSADCPWNMNPTGGIQETAELLRACNQIGLKFDRLACHTYRASPESPDLDADAALYFDSVGKLGYTKEPLFWSEMMHWGPYTIPAWGVASADWMGSPRTWIGGAISYDMGWMEKISAAWRARSWLVALKYSDRVRSACAASDKNNFAMDLNLTPFASQVMPNTLGNLLGDSKFKKDVRFAAYIRTYIFEDARKRPVAAVWCHLPALDEGRQDAPVAEADFGNSLESVIDLMNNERAFKPGKVSFAVTSFPLFFRGKPGTLPAMVKAFENAVILSGEGVSPLLVSANPSTPDKAELKLKNLLSTPFDGTIGTTEVKIAGAAEGKVLLPLPEVLAYDRIAEEKLPVRIQGKSGGNISMDLSFRGSLCKRVPDSATLESMDWKTVPAVRLTVSKGKPALSSGVYRTAWNRKGFFLRVEIKDAKFSHLEFSKTESRWANDSLQVYFDTFADARSRQAVGYDENDYDYLILPNAAGNSCSVYRNRMVDWQLGLGTSQEKAGTFAKDIPTKFTKIPGGYVYEIFFPAKHILPIQLKEGYPFGFGVHVPNADDPAVRTARRAVSSLTNSGDGTDCYNKPHLWPVLLLWK